MLLRTCFPYISWPSNWNELYPRVEQIKHHTSITQVIWQRPEAQFVKVNSDKSALNNPGKIGAGVIIRDHTSEFIHVIATPLGEGTKILTEVEAAIIGVQWCLNNGFHKVHLEEDSTLLIQWLNKNKPPSTLRMKLQKLKELSLQCEEFRSSHVYREGNCPADSLYKLSHELPAMTHLHFHQLNLTTLEDRFYKTPSALQPLDTKTQAESLHNHNLLMDMGKIRATKGAYLFVQISTPMASYDPQTEQAPCSNPSRGEHWCSLVY